MGADHWILSIDGGGTKTDLLLCNAERLTGAQTTGEGTNPNIYGKKGIESLVRQVTDILNRVNSSSEDIHECIIGMAGISHPKYRNDIENCMSLTLPNSSLRFTSDAELAHRSIWGSHPGMTLIVGTGSIALGTNNEGRVLRSGGFGYQMGDEGSGYWLGKVLLTELIAAERSTFEDVIDLIEKVTEQCGQATFENALTVLSSSENSISRVANLAPVVLSFAENGNLLASKIVSQGVEALGVLIEELSEKLGFNGGQKKIGISGSVISKSDFYRGLIKDQLLYQFDSVEWQQSDFPPVYGALMLAKNRILPTDFSRMIIQHV